MDDLAAWLTAIWDEQEGLARFTADLIERSHPADEFDIEWRWAKISRHKTSGGSGASFEMGAPSPTEVLARIAADRQILARLGSYCWDAQTPDEGATWEPCGTCDRVGCATLRDMAAPYADRPGYREEWRP